MFSDAYFTFDGISSESMGVICCRTSGDIIERQFGINRSSITEKNINNPIPFSFGYETEVLTGEIILTSIECIKRKSRPELDTKKLAEIARWLYQKDYKPLIFNDNPDIVFYVKFVDEHQMNNTLNDEGFINLKFECDAPWGWTKPYIQEFDLRKSTEPFYFDIENVGSYYDYNCLELEVQLPDDDIDVGQVSIRNTRNCYGDDNAFIIKNVEVNGFVIDKYKLNSKEIININMQKREVESNNESIPSRLQNCNKKWINLEYGMNRIKVDGKCFLKTRCQCPVLI